jgi:uncharacterized protein YjbJ (UPF0337 family)
VTLVFVAGQDGYKTLCTNERGKDTPMGRDSRKDKNEGALDKAKGRAKEAAGSLSGNKDRKAEGQADQDKGTLKKKKGAAKDLLS